MKYYIYLKFKSGSEVNISYKSIEDATQDLIKMYKSPFMMLDYEIKTSETDFEVCWKQCKLPWVFTHKQLLESRIIEF